MEFKKIIPTVIVLIIFTCLLGLGARYLEKRYISKKQAETENTVSMDSAGESIGLPDKDGSYIGDVAYDGSEQVDDRVFQYPFKKTDEYVANKSLIKKRDKTYFTNAKKFVTDYFQKLYGTGYHEIESDRDSFVENAVSFYLPNSYNWANESIDDVALDNAEYIKENHIQAEINVDTADYLVYEDGMTYVRGVVNVTSYQCDAESTYDQLGLELAHDGSYVFETELYPNGTWKGDVFFVISNRILGEVESQNS